MSLLDGDSTSAFTIERIIRGDGQTCEYVDANGDWHRGDDLPAIEYANSDAEWWVHGRRHREGDRPAVISLSRGQEWWVHGVLHREEDQPAVVRPSGLQEWFWFGRQHRERGPAFVTVTGQRSWFWHGVQADDDRAERLQRIHDWTVFDTTLPQHASVLLGNDPWVARVLLSRPELVELLPKSVVALATLLALDGLAEG